MTQRKRLVVLISFDEILVEYETFNHLLWFNKKGIKTVIESIIDGLPALYATPFNEVDIEQLYVDLYGNTPQEVMQNEYYKSIEDLDRCNAEPVDLQEDAILIKFVISDLVNDVQNQIRQVFSQDTIWDADPIKEITWRGNNLILPVLI